MRVVIFLLLIKLLIQPSISIIGFDCERGNLNVTTFSMGSDTKCNGQKAAANSTEIGIELLQLAEFRSIHVIQCKVEIRRTVYHCGWWDHLIPADNGEQEFLHDTSYDVCQRLHETGTFMYDTVHYITNLRANDTRTTGVDFAGIAGDGKCSGASYADNFGTYSNALVQGTIKVTLMDFHADVNLDEDEVILRSGTICKYSKNKCLDLVGGYTFWEQPKFTDCFTRTFDILYKGVGMKTEIANKKKRLFTR